MRYPSLVKKRDCRTNVHVELTPEGLDEYGTPLQPVMIDATCNYQDTAKTVLTAEKKLVQLAGVALFPGDIAPDMPTLSGGTLKVNGQKRTIFQGRKARNPDGSVNYSELEVM